MNPIARLRRRAQIELDQIDADVARWLVDDGSLSLDPLDGPLSGWRVELRVRRLAAVRHLVAAGGVDPWPSVLAPPTAAQRNEYLRARGRL